MREAPVSAGPIGAGQNPADADGTPPLLPVRFDKVRFSINGTELLHDLSFAIGPGTRTVIMGPNGAGKSLLLRLLQGLLQPTQGRITWQNGWRAGAKAGQGKSSAPPVSIVLQRPVLLRRSVAANLTHALRVLGVPRAERPARLEQLLDLGNLTERRDQPARSLSGGEQQRLATVRALAGKPAMLLLDEPTASLDPQATKAIEDLAQNSHERGTKIVMVTHDTGQAQRMADEVIFMAKGRIVEAAPADMFFGNPQSDEARTYLSGRLVI